MVMRFENRVRNVAVSNDLNRAVVVVELLGSDDVRRVAMNVPIDADDTLHHAGNRAQVVRHHHNSNALVQLLQKRIQLPLETVIHEDGRLVKNQQTRVGNQRTTQQRALHLSARDLANRSTRNRLQTCLFE